MVPGKVFPLGGRAGFYHADYPIFLWGMGKAPVTDYFMRSENSGPTGYEYISRGGWNCK